jgi:tetratricopeptide (TPR) repeat protein
VLFDLSSPGRKNIIRVVYGVLALLFLIGFVGFGIGGELGGGGIVDSLTGGGGDGDTAEQFEQQIEDAEAALETNPADEKALANLTEYRYLSGQAQLDVDEATGAPILTEEARGEFEAAIDAWTRYLETDPAKPDVSAAGQVVQAYVLLGNAEGAAEAQEILAEDNPSSGAYSTLAYYYYADFDFKRGDEAAQRAVEETNENQKKAVEKQLDQLRESAVKEEKRIEKLSDSEAGAEEGLQSPFGGLDSGGSVPLTSP